MLFGWILRVLGPFLVACSFHASSESVWYICRLLWLDSRPIPGRIPAECDYGRCGREINESSPNGACNQPKSDTYVKLRPCETLDCFDFTRFGFLANMRWKKIVKSRLRKNACFLELSTSRLYLTRYGFQKTISTSLQTWLDFTHFKHWGVVHPPHTALP